MDVHCFDENSRALYHNKILIASDTYEEIAARLNAMGLKENINYMAFDKFVTLFFWYRKQQLVLDNVQVSCTTRCTLKCESCMALIPFCKRTGDEPLGSIKETIDLYFSLVDKVASFRIIGGEPFLYPGLPELISYIGKNFGDKVRKIECTTNGTIMPGDGLLDMFVRYHCKINISDYSVSNPFLKEKADKLEHCFIENGVQVNRHRNYIWQDMRFTDKDFEISEGQAALHRQKCNLSCQHIQNGRYFLCSVLYYANKAGFTSLGDADSLDLHHITKEEMFYYNLGVIKGGAFSLCRNCAGNDVMYKKEITAGIQIRDKEG